MPPPSGSRPVQSGISFDGDWWLLWVVASIFGAINVSLRPILKMLTRPPLIVTLGALHFRAQRTGTLPNWDDFRRARPRISRRCFVPACVGALMVTAVSFAPSLFPLGPAPAGPRVPSSIGEHLANAAVPPAFAITPAARRLGRLVAAEKRSGTCLATAARSGGHLHGEVRQESK